MSASVKEGNIEAATKNYICSLLSGNPVGHSLHPAVLPNAYNQVPENRSTLHPLVAAQLGHQATNQPTSIPFDNGIIESPDNVIVGESVHNKFSVADAKPSFPPEKKLVPLYTRSLFNVETNDLSLPIRSDKNIMPEDTIPIAGLPVGLSNQGHHFINGDTQVSYKIKSEVEGRVCSVVGWSMAKYSNANIRSGGETRIRKYCLGIFKCVASDCTVVIRPQIPSSPKYSISRYLVNFNHVPYTANNLSVTFPAERF